MLDELGARPAAALLRRRLRERGVTQVPRGPTPTTRANPAGLTDRQVEILRLLAAGRTNAEIAAKLVLSVRTVDHHVSAVLQKLGITSRREVAGAAARLGLAVAPCPPSMWVVRPARPGQSPPWWEAVAAGALVGPAACEGAPP